MPDLNKIIEDLSSLTVAEAADLSKQLEEKWGVTAAAPVAAVAPGAAAPAAEEKSNNTVKGDLIKSAFVTSTMGVSYKLKLGKTI